MNFSISNWKDCSEFLEQYHYQGSGNNDICFSLTHDNKLVAVAVFAHVTRKEIAIAQYLKQDQIRELSRLCIHPSFQFPNLGTYFLAKCRKALKNNTGIIRLVSFCDPNYGHDGAIYKADNWTLDGETAPNYYYVKGCNIIHKKTVWNKAKSLNISESQYAIDNNLIKVKAQPKLRFIKDLR